MSLWLGVGTFFFILKHAFMKYYLIHQENELRLIPVAQEKEIDFLLEYSLQILTSRTTIQEVLQLFDEMPLVFCDDL